ncbi:MAG: hypothetical protein IPK80_02455 [Nannocystis sp.]|nr:hypothetical protein [Nannocystis sp.]
MTNDEEAEIRAYVAELEASIRAAELRLARTDSVLDEAREEAAQWKRLAEQTTDARLAEAIASREVMQRERDEARRELLDLDLVLPAACGSRVDAARQLEAERDEARAQLAALHAAASAVQAKARALPVSMTEIVHAEEWDDLDRVLADLATAAAEHERRVRAPVEAERDRLAAALAEVRDAASESIRESFWVGNDAPARAARERVIAVLAALPTDLAAQREARIRADSTHEAARARGRAVQYPVHGIGAEVPNNADEAERGGA